MVLCEEASTNDALVAAVRSSADAAVEDGSDYDGDPTPDVPSKEAVFSVVFSAFENECLHRVRMYCTQNSLSDKTLQCVSVVEDEIIRRAVKKQRRTKMTSFFR